MLDALSNAKSAVLDKIERKKAANPEQVTENTEEQTTTVQAPEAETAEVTGESTGSSATAAPEEGGTAEGAEATVENSIESHANAEANYAKASIKNSDRSVASAEGENATATIEDSADSTAIAQGDDSDVAITASSENNAVLYAAQGDEEDDSEVEVKGDSDNNNILVAEGADGSEVTATNSDNNQVTVNADDSAVNLNDTDSVAAEVNGSGVELNIDGVSEQSINVNGENITVNVNGDQIEVLDAEGESLESGTIGEEGYSGQYINVAPGGVPAEREAQAININDGSHNDLGWSDAREARQAESPDGTIAGDIQGNIEAGTADAAQGDTVTYTVESGDTLNEVSEATLRANGEEVTPEAVNNRANEIAQANNITDPNLINVGQQLDITSVVTLPEAEAPEAEVPEMPEGSGETETDETGEIPEELEFVSTITTGPGGGDGVETLAQSVNSATNADGQTVEDVAGEFQRAVPSLENDTVTLFYEEGSITYHYDDTVHGGRGQWSIQDTTIEGTAPAAEDSGGTDAVPQNAEEVAARLEETAPDLSDVTSPSTLDLGEGVEFTGETVAGGGQSGSGYSNQGTYYEVQVGDETYYAKYTTSTVNAPGQPQTTTFSGEVLTPEELEEVTGEDSDDTTAEDAELPNLTYTYTNGGDTVEESLQGQLQEDFGDTVEVTENDSGQLEVSIDGEPAGTYINDGHISGMPAGSSQWHLATEEELTEAAETAEDTEAAEDAGEFNAEAAAVDFLVRNANDHDGQQGIPSDGSYNDDDFVIAADRVFRDENLEDLEQVRDTAAVIDQINANREALSALDGESGDLNQTELENIQSLLAEGYTLDQLIAEGELAEATHGDDSALVEGENISPDEVAVSGEAQDEQLAQIDNVLTDGEITEDGIITEGEILAVAPNDTENSSFYFAVLGYLNSQANYDNAITVEELSEIRGYVDRGLNVNHVLEQYGR